MSAIKDRFNRSLSRVGPGMAKNARWFLRFVEEELERFRGSQFEDYWDDLITLCQLGDNEGRKRPSSRKNRPEKKISIRIGPGTTVVYNNQRYESGIVVELPESIAIGIVRGSSAKYVSQPPVVRHDRQTTEALLNAWENAAKWPTGYRLADGEESVSARRDRFVDEIKAIHQKIRSAVMDYLGGAEPIICLREVCFRLGPGQLLPASPFSVLHFTDDGRIHSGVEASVLVRFIQVFNALGQGFRQCPSCHRLFMANREDKRTCSGSCRAKFGMRRLRKNRRELAKRRMMTLKERRGRMLHQKKRKTMDGTKKRAR